MSPSPAFIAATSHGGGLSGTTTFPITVPTVTDGDRLLLWIANDVGTDPDPTSQGWTALGVAAGPDARAGICHWWTKIAASEPVSYTFPFGGPTTVNVGIMESWSDLGMDAVPEILRQQGVTDGVGVGHIDNDQVAGGGPIADEILFYVGMWTKGNNNVTTEGITPDPGVTERAQAVTTEFGVIGSGLSVGDLHVVAAAQAPAWAYDFDYQLGVPFRNSVGTVGQSYVPAPPNLAGPGFGLGSAPMFG